MDVTGTKFKKIYDPIYGPIDITALEWDIIHSPFYQRLRWIRQLGLSCYVFPGAEHSRFGHSIGVMHNAHCILNCCGRGVDFQELCNTRSPTKESQYHQQIRVAALLHDLGTFPFSHTTEGAYMRHWEDRHSSGSKKARTNGGLSGDNHEVLGAYIIQNTRYAGGITSILEKYKIDPQIISDLVRGEGKSILANQILHSEVDCDRMDYLLRDAHYTGLNYGTYDRDYLLLHFRVANVGGNEVLAIKDNALHCIDDFLLARFAWYSQVIRSARGAKFDALAEELYYLMLKKNMVYQFDDLMELVAKDPYRYYQFNDTYFMSLIGRYWSEGAFKGSKMMTDLARCILFEESPQVINRPEFKQKLLNQDELPLAKKQFKKCEEIIHQIEEVIAKKGTKSDWIVKDIPSSNIVLVKSFQNLVRDTKRENVLLERDPVKIMDESGEIKVLAEMENSIIGKLQNIYNFTPNVYCSESTHHLLVREGIVPKLNKLKK